MLSIEQNGSGKGRKSVTLTPKPSKSKAHTTKLGVGGQENEWETEISRHESKKAKKYGRP